ncbi:MAG: sulfatase [Planctomycetia bacterium]|jgi:arylsulfatase A-like enzyme
MKLTRILTIVLLSIVSFSLVVQAEEQKAKPKPNFVFILVDDMGWRGVGCFGSTYYETPRIDGLAAEGMKFTDAYTACHVCSPTRASIMTGQYPARLHLTDYLPGRTEPYVKLMRPVMYHHLPYETTTVAEALKPLGYATAAIGKWHLGGKRSLPTEHGFDLNFGGCEAGHHGRMFWPYGTPDVKKGVKGEYLTDRLTDEAIKFMDKNQDRPFFLYLSHYAVHRPIQAKKEMVERYREKENKDPCLKDPTYAAMTESVDESTGRVLDHLKKLGIDDRTVVFFMSDNGQRQELEIPPLRCHKGTMFEGGIRVPMIVKWPGITKPGTTCDEPVISTDFFPTILDMAGAKSRDVDGKSLVPLLKEEDGTFDRDAIYWHYPHYSNHFMPPCGAIRQGDWKLIEFYEDGSLQLYNLKEDLSEKHNLAKKMPEKAKAMQAKLEAWRKSVNAQEMTPNPNYNPAKTSWNRRRGKIINVYDTPPE